MRIQDAVLDALEKNRGEYLSGEQLASSLGVSRNAVWKAIQKLEEAGHKIRAVPKRGYTLAPESDVLTVQSVSRFLDTDMPVYLQVQTEVTSTNTLLKAQAEQGAPEGHRAHCGIADGRQGQARSALHIAAGYRYLFQPAAPPALHR